MCRNFTRTLVAWTLAIGSHVMLCADAQASTIRADTPDGSYMSRATQMDFSLSFGGLAMKQTGEDFYRFRGGGVIVNDRYILTTRHQWDFSFTDAQFRVGYNIGAPDETIGIVNWWTHPLYNPNDLPGYGYDLVVAELEHDVSVGQPIGIYKGPVTAGMHTEMISAGYHGTGNTGGIDFDANIRSWEDNIQGLSGDPQDPLHLVGPNHVFLEFAPPGFGALPFEGSMAIFDSGSLAATNANGSWELWGLQTALTGNGFYWDWSIIREVGTDYDTFNWIETTAHITPEPSTVLLLAAGLALVMRRSRR